ncbi:MAG: peptidyl-prolyl cis-trans isomerase [Chthoniobacterales bacterium]
MNLEDARPGGGLRLARLLLLFAIAAAGGLVCGELLTRWPAARSAVARALGRGELLAIVHGVGIYASTQGDENAESAVMLENLRRAARTETVSDEQVEREFALFRHQYPDDGKAFPQALQASGLSETTLRGKIVDHLRGRSWVERRIVAALEVTDADCESFYEENTSDFLQPPRYRASHLFLAAPDGSAVELVDAKQKTISAFGARIAGGETLAQLATEASEDDATKLTGGDLGFFAANRMPSEFIAEIKKLQVGQTSAPFRSHLGFHIAQLTELEPGRALPFEEAHAEIALLLQNEKRATAVADLAEGLLQADYVRPLP